jgi:hypothetical protein
VQRFTLVIALLAIFISVASFIRSERREGRRERREARTEQREVDKSAERRRGKPIIIARGGGRTADRVRHDYEIRNDGQSTITDLVLWIVDGERRPVSTCAGGDGFVLAPNDAPVVASVDVLQPVPAGEVTLVMSWTDADGRHGPESTRIHPPRHR